MATTWANTMMINNADQFIFSASIIVEIGMYRRNGFLGDG